jgi:hypothetical protein
MSTIVTRAGKGSALTHTEVDANFTNLNNDKIQSGNTVASLTITSADINGGTVDGTAIGGSSASTGAFTTLSATGVTTVQAGTAAAPAITTSGDTNTGIFFPAADTIAFTEGGVESMRIDASGNLGLGVTPSAWGSNYKVLSANTRGLTFAGGVDAGVITLNAYNDGVWRFAGTSSFRSARYELFDGVHYWYTGNSGTAGNAITFTQAMTLDASGNLLVGATVASYSAANRGNITVGGANGAIVALQVNGTSSGYLFSYSTAMELWNSANTPLVFGTNNTERARITAGGYSKFSDNGTYIGSASNYHEFRNTVADWITVNSNTNASPYGLYTRYVNADPNGTDNEFLQFVGNLTLRAELRSNGGLANYSGNNVNLSDRREKTNFAPAGEYLSKICAIPVQTFNYIDQNMEDDPGLTLGVVAQNVQEVAPELVMESNWGTEEEPKMRLSIYQTDLQYALMKCIQELKAELDATKAEVALLKGAK